MALMRWRGQCPTYPQHATALGVRFCIPFDDEMMKFIFILLIIIAGYLLLLFFQAILNKINNSNSVYNKI